MDSAALKQSIPSDHHQQKQSEDEPVMAPQNDRENSDRSAQNMDQ